MSRTAAFPSALLLIAGPTAAGKSGLAEVLCERLGGEIVSADSVQVYRGFDIGSAKPSLESRRRIPHHLIDVRDPDAPLHAGDFARLADEAIVRIIARGRLPVVVGGTGLWIRALLHGLVPLPPPDRALRERLGAEADRVGLDAMHRRLRRVDPRAAARIHPRDRVRLLRALEVFEQTGEPLGELQRRHARGAPRYAHRVLFVDQPRAVLDARIARRIDEFLARGWLEEVRGLLCRWGRTVRPMGSVGYRQMAEHLLEGVSFEQARERAITATRRYARRQRTWWRGEPAPWRAGTPECLSDSEVIEALRRWRRDPLSG